mgnify:CR=1 FL=1
MCSSHAPKYSLMLLYPIPLQSYFPCFPLHKISIEYTHLYSITESEKERASPLANRPPAARNSGFAYALSIHRPMQRDTRHSTDWLLTLQSISSRGQITFVATSKSSSSIVHSSRSGSAQSNLPVIPSKAPLSTLTCPGFPLGDV